MYTCHYCMTAGNAHFRWFAPTLTTFSFHVLITLIVGLYKFLRMSFKLKKMYHSAHLVQTENVWVNPPPKIQISLQNSLATIFSASASEPSHRVSRVRAYSKVTWGHCSLVMSLTGVCWVSDITWGGHHIARWPLTYLITVRRQSRQSEVSLCRRRTFFFSFFFFFLSGPAMRRASWLIMDLHLWTCLFYF